MTDPTPPDRSDTQLPTSTELFAFTEERRFQLYVERRKRYSDGAREAYQRFHQAIVGLSAGLIVLSVSFLKDIGHSSDSLAWLLASWAFVLLGSLLALSALITSGEADRDRIIQLDCLARTSECDESRAEKLGRITVRLNFSAASFCILGVAFMIVFATINVLQLTTTKRWGVSSAIVPSTNPAPQARVRRP